MERKRILLPFTVSQFQRRFGVTNYYRKARSLGITGKYGGYVADFAKSKIGRWMIACGLHIDADHWDEMRSLLIVLCGVIFDSFDETSTS